MALDYSFDPSFNSSGLDQSAVWEGMSGAGGDGEEDGWASILKGIGGTAGKVAGSSSGLLSLLSSVYGLVGSNQITQMAKGAFNQANPFGAYRPQYAQQLQQLMANPSSIKDSPGYQFQMDQGSQAVSRRMGASGFHGSSNEAIALDKYGQDYASNFYDKELQRLMTLSGATITPAGAGTGIQGASMGLDFAGQALASLGYGVTKSGGGFNSAGGVAANAGALASLAGKFTGNKMLSTVGGNLSGVSSIFGLGQGIKNKDPVSIVSNGLKVGKYGSKLLGGSSAAPPALISPISTTPISSATAQGAASASKAIGAANPGSGIGAAGALGLAAYFGTFAKPLWGGDNAVSGTGDFSPGFDSLDVNGNQVHSNNMQEFTNLLRGFQTEHPENYVNRSSPEPGTWEYDELMRTVMGYGP